MTGKTVEDAIEIGLRELDVSRVEVEIDIISRGKAGLLGIGSEPAKVKVSKLDVSSDEITIAAQTINDLISMLGVEVICNLTQANIDEISSPLFEIEGEDSALLIGRRGETLRALQLIVRLIVMNKTDQKINLSLDIEGYDSRHQQSLNNLAERVAQRVLKTSRSIELEPMTARDRRVVHLALAEKDEVHTESVGDGYDRRVVIIPS
jgi:spoIIIJ-associated protein